MNRMYVLDGHTPVPTDDERAFGKMFASAERIVKKTEKDGVEVSTVFLGLDHRFSQEGPPILFETLVFGGDWDQEMWRYSTWEEAEEGHRKMCEKVFPPKNAKTRTLIL